MSLFVLDPDLKAWRAAEAPTQKREGDTPRANLLWVPKEGNVCSR